MSQESCNQQYKKNLAEDKRATWSRNFINGENFSDAVYSEEHIREKMQDVWRGWGVPMMQRELWTLTYFHTNVDIVPSSMFKRSKHVRGALKLCR